MEITMFNKTYKFDYAYEIKSFIKAIKTLKNEISQSFVLSYEGFSLVTFLESETLYHDNFGDVICEYLHEIYKTSDYIRQTIFNVSDEDTEWTAQRNKDLNDVWYRKLTFKPEIQTMLTNEIDSAINTASIMLEKENIKNQQAKDAAEAQENALLEGVLWEIEEKDITDEGGKTKEYIHNITINGTTYIFKERNIFDVGIAITDKNGLIDVSDMQGDELRAAQIVIKYGKFANSSVRM